MLLPLVSSARKLALRPMDTVADPWHFIRDKGNVAEYQESTVPEPFNVQDTINLLEYPEVMILDGTMVVEIESNEKFLLRINEYMSRRWMHHQGPNLRWSISTVRHAA